MVPCMDYKPHITLVLTSRAATRVAAGYPWIFRSDVTNASDLQNTAVVHFANPGGRILGLGYAHPKNQLMGRVLSRDATAVDEGLFADKFRAAQNWRKLNFAHDHYRLVHAESDGLPGLVVDRFGDTLVAQANTAGMDMLSPLWISALVNVTGATHLVLKNDGNTRTLEGLAEEIKTVRGSVPESGLVELLENDVRFYADVKQGQKTGWFFDQRPHRAWVAARAHGKRVADIFCHTGGFGITAGANGAAHITFVDTSSSAIALTRKNAELNKIVDKSTFIEGKAFDVLESMTDEYDIMCVDPPAFVKVKKDMDAGLRGYEKLARLAVPRVADGGILFYASCSSHPTDDMVLNAVLNGAAKAGRAASLVYTGTAGPDHPMHPQLPETRYLKAFAFRITR